jgi:uncharacterized protein (DUF3820 family)
MQFFQEQDHQPEISTEEALEYTLDFGKHQGETLQALCVSWDGRGYLKYILSSDPEPLLKQSLKQALKSTPEVKCTLEQAGDTTMPFGKCKGMFLRAIVAESCGMSYLRWVSKWDKCVNVSLKEAISIINEEYERQRKMHEEIE